MSFCFQLLGISQRFTPEDTAKPYCGVKEQLSVTYVTLNISQGDPEVDLFQSQPSVLGGSHFKEMLYLLNVGLFVS